MSSYIMPWLHNHFLSNYTIKGYDEELFMTQNMIFFIFIKMWKHIFLNYIVIIRHNADWHDNSIPGASITPLHDSSSNIGTEVLISQWCALCGYKTHGKIVWQWTDDISQVYWILVDNKKDTFCICRYECNTGTM